MIFAVNLLNKNKKSIPGRICAHMCRTFFSAYVYIVLKIYFNNKETLFLKSLDFSGKVNSFPKNSMLTIFS